MNEEQLREQLTATLAALQADQAGEQAHLHSGGLTPHDNQVIRDLAVLRQETIAAIREVLRDE